MNNNTKILTLQDIENGKSIHGGYTKNQILEWGGDWPLVKGWKQKLIGKTIKINNNKINNLLPINNTQNKVYNSFNEIPTNNVEFIYTDGACTNNGKHNAKAGFGIYFKQNDTRNTSIPITNGNQTNNYAELMAINYIFNLLDKKYLVNRNIVIVSDSKYAIRCCTDYGKLVFNKNKKNVPNNSLILMTYKLVIQYPNISFIHILAHTSNKDIHSIGNYHADKLANKAISLNWFS